MQHEIGIVLRIKNLKKTKQQLDSLFDKKTQQNQKKYNKNLSQTEKRTKRTSKASKRAGQSFKGMAKNVLGSLAAFRAFSRGLQTTLTLMREGGGLERASESFNRSVGSINKRLPQLRRATMGTVEDFKLLKTATRAVAEGLGKENLVRTFEMATSSAQHLNLTTSQTIGTVTKAINRLDESALNTLGILSKVKKEYAAQQGMLGKFGSVVGKVSQLEHRRSFILKALAERYGELGKAQLDSLMILNQARAAFRNFRKTLGIFASQVFKPLIQGFSTVTNQISDTFRTLSNNEAIVETARKITFFVGAIGTAIATIAALKLAFMGLTFTLSGMTVPLLALSTMFVGLFKTFGDTELNLKKVISGLRAFFTLITTYDSESGLAKVLKKDKEELGGLYGGVVRLAKYFVVFKNIAQGVFAGLGAMIQPLVDLVGSDLSVSFREVFSKIEKGEPLSSKALKRLRNEVQETVITVGRLVSGVTTLVGLLTTAAGIITTLTGAGAVAGIPLILKGLGLTAAGGAGSYMVDKASTTKNKNKKLAGTPNIGKEKTPEESKVIKDNKKVTGVRTKGEEEKQAKTPKVVINNPKIPDVSKKDKKTKQNLPGVPTTFKYEKRKNKTLVEAISKFMKGNKEDIKKSPLDRVNRNKFQEDLEGGREPDSLDNSGSMRLMEDSAENDSDILKKILENSEKQIEAIKEGSKETRRTREEEAQRKREETAQNIQASRTGASGSF